MRSLRIRSADEGDLVAAKEISHRAFGALRSIYRPKAEANAQKERTESHYEHLVGESNGRVVATLEYRVAWDRLHVRGLAVDPDHQAQGLARQMLDGLVEIARVRGLVSITLYTIEETGKVAFFQHLGFSVVAREVATWCESDRFAVLHETKMARPITENRARAPDHD